MNISIYREQTEDLRIIANHYHSCVDDAERMLWAARARSFVCTLDDCKRKSTGDAELRELALKEVILLLSETAVVKAGIAKKGASTTNTRAFNYNKSPARAVRLRRAAKTARKSACWH